MDTTALKKQAEAQRMQQASKHESSLNTMELLSCCTVVLIKKLSLQHTV